MFSWIYHFNCYFIPSQTVASKPRKWGSDIGFTMLFLWHKKNMVKILKRIINMYVFDFWTSGDNEFQGGNFDVLSKDRN